MCFLHLEQHSKAFESNVKAREYLNKFKNSMTAAQYGKNLYELPFKTKYIKVT